MSSTLLLPEQPANTVPKPAPLAKVELDDLAYLLKVAAAEATKVKRNGSAPEAIQLSAQSG